MASVWWVNRSGKQFGPFAAAELANMAASGRLLRSDSVRQDGKREWHIAGELKGLFKADEAPEPPPMSADVASEPPPMAAAVHATQESGGDSTGGLIPYKNPKALIAYYTGLLFLLPPCCFAPLGIVPLVFGILALRDRSRKPVIKGSVHAWIGIILGSLGLLGFVLVLLYAFMMFSTQ